jgi:hypothetical protein
MTTIHALAFEYLHLTEFRSSKQEVLAFNYISCSEFTIVDALAKNISEN